MSRSHPTQTVRRRRRSATLGVLLIVAALLAGGVALRSSPDTTSTWGSSWGISDSVAHRQHNGDDGEVPAGVTVFDSDYAAVSHLDPALLGALQRAARDAAGSGIELNVNSGWRSPAYQRQLLDRAVAEYGSRAAAARWVATPDTSPHVSGHAVDIGPSAASTWLAEYGSAYGLCQIYGNEPWHFELRPDAIDHGCPAAYADPTQDPRMQQ